MKIDLTQKITTPQNQKTSVESVFLFALESANSQICDPGAAKKVHDDIKASENKKYDLHLDDVPVVRSCVKAICVNKIIWQVDEILDPTKKEK